MKDNSLISIIISTRGKPWTLLSKTLDSIISSDFTDFEIILVDQNQNSGIEIAITGDSKYKNIKYFKSSQKGLSRGRNFGMSHSTGNWFLFFDDDAILPKDALCKISHLLIKNLIKPLIYCGTVLSLDNNKPYLKKAVAMGNKINLFNFDSVCSIALIFNRKLFNKIGYFDEELGTGCKFGGSEETDIIIRALKQKFKIIFLEDFKVYHPPSNVTGFTKRESYGMGAGALYRKHIFSSFIFFIILASRLLAEISIRSALVLLNVTHADLKKYHYFYVKGIIKGFLQFSNNRYS